MPVALTTATSPGPVSTKAPGAIALYCVRIDGATTSGSVSLIVGADVLGAPPTTVTESLAAVGGELPATTRASENSEVLPAGSVAVAVRYVPGAAVTVVRNTPPLDAFVVTEAVPRKVFPSPKPEGSA